MGMTHSYGTRDDDESQKTIERAIDLGCTLLDTAEVYGPFDNEFSGEVNWVQIELQQDDQSHLISPEERFRLAMARQ